MAPEVGRGEGGGGRAGAAEARALAVACDLCQQRMQTVADLLLLTSDPRPVRTPSLSVFGESVGRCRETVASRGRGLAVLLRDLAALLQREPPPAARQLRACAEEVSELVVSLTECCAHAAYLLAVLQDGSSPEAPGPVDRYQLCRAAAEVEHKTGLLRTYSLRTVTALQLTDICISVTESASVLTDGCLKAADEAPEESVREQFRLCLKNISATVSTFCASVKFLKDRPTDLNYRACQVFGEALATSCNALAVFATQDPRLMGARARLSASGRETLGAVLSACMGVVSPCVLACSLVRELALRAAGGGGGADKALARVQQCQAAVQRSSARLALALAGPEPAGQPR